jgi:hypothetical protein
MRHDGADGRSSNARLTDIARRGHASRAPVRRVIRALLRGQRHDSLDLACRDLRLAPGRRLVVLDTRHTVGDKASPRD